MGPLMLREKNKKLSATGLPADVLFNRGLELSCLWVLAHGTRAQLVPLTLHSMELPCQHRKLILALYRAHQMCLIPSGQKNLGDSEGDTVSSSHKVLYLADVTRGSCSIQSTCNSSSVQLKWFILLIYWSAPHHQQIINIQHTPLSSLVLSQLPVLRVYRFSSQILQLYMIPHTHCHQLPPSNSKSIYCSTYWQPKDIGSLMGLKEPSSDL